VFGIGDVVGDVVVEVGGGSGGDSACEQRHEVVAVEEPDGGPSWLQASGDASSSTVASRNATLLGAAACGTTLSRRIAAARDRASRRAHP
jgi:hypothetical protein